MFRLLKTHTSLNSIRGFEGTVGTLRGPIIRGYTYYDNKATEMTSPKRYKGPMVISWISGCFSNSSSFKHLTSKVFQGEETTSETSLRWFEERLPKRCGFLNGFNKFDGKFFDITAQHAHRIDPQNRLLLEIASEAITDEDLCGSRTAVFSGPYGGETLFKFQMRPNSDVEAYQYSSYSFMIPEQLSSQFDFRGRSADGSTGCFSSLTVLHSANLCLEYGQCKAALITASTVHLSPTFHKFLVALNALAMDGRCKAFAGIGKTDRLYKLSSTQTGLFSPNLHLRKPRKENKIEPNLDLLVLPSLSGRSEFQVQKSLEEASEDAMKPEVFHLMNKAYQRHMPGHSRRGVALIQPTRSISSICAQRCDTINRPVWIVFPVIGSQYNAMEHALVKLHPFAESIGRSRATLLNVGLNLDKLLAAGNESIFVDIHHALVAITAVEIALWDTLSCIGIRPEGFVGHSFGELLCAYADDCLSAEETLLLADALGRACKDSQTVIGGMAFIATSAKNTQIHLPPELDIACFNADQNVTVSGELNAVATFVVKMQREGIKAAMVNSCGFAAHSHYAQDASDLFQRYMTDINIQSIGKKSRPRSSRWISTTFSESEWDSSLAKSCSVRYFDWNIRNPVYFNDAAKLIPSGSVVVEVSPRGIFKALLSKSVPEDCIHVAPMTLKVENKLDHFFQSVGKMYLSGVDIKLEKLYTPACAYTSETMTESG